MTYYARIPASLGPLLAVADDDGLTGLHFEDGRYVPAIASDWIESPDHPVLARCAAQVAAYLEGRAGTFDLPLAPRGTPFQQRVWRAIAGVPFGDTVSYAELARRAGSSGAVRAVGAATGRNPISIIVPCHRIVGTGGALTGYAGGLPRKASLLALETAARDRLR